jgi:hypothetical protein
MHLGSFVLALTAAGAICAQEPATPKDFSTLDKNKDGRVSSTEAEGRAELHDIFDALDKNHDGFLTATEFSAWSGAGNTKDAVPVDPTTGPGGSSGAQHMPKT